MANSSFKIICKGDYSGTKKYLASLCNTFDEDYIRKVCDDTIIKLKKASPDERIALGWSYEIIHNKKYISIFFNNSYVVDGTNIALIVNSGHATKGGKWISGKHFIEKPVQDAYEEILRHTWEEMQ